MIPKDHYDFLKIPLASEPPTTKKLDRFVVIGLLLDQLCQLYKVEIINRPERPFGFTLLDRWWITATDPETGESISNCTGRERPTREDVSAMLNDWIEETSDDNPEGDRS